MNSQSITSNSNSIINLLLPLLLLLLIVQQQQQQQQRGVSYAFVPNTVRHSYGKDRFVSSRIHSDFNNRNHNPNLIQRIRVQTACKARSGGPSIFPFVNDNSEEDNDNDNDQASSSSSSTLKLNAVDVMMEESKEIERRVFELEGIIRETERELEAVAAAVEDGSDDTDNGDGMMKGESFWLDAASELGNILTNQENREKELDADVVQKTEIQSLKIKELESNLETAQYELDVQLTAAKEVKEKLLRAEDELEFQQMEIEKEKFEALRRFQNQQETLKKQQANIQKDNVRLVEEQNKLREAIEAKMYDLVSKEKEIKKQAEQYSAVKSNLESILKRKQEELSQTEERLKRERDLFRRRREELERLVLEEQAKVDEIEAKRQTAMNEFNEQKDSLEKRIETGVNDRRSATSELGAKLRTVRKDFTTKLISAKNRARREEKILERELQRELRTLDSEIRSLQVERQVQKEEEIIAEKLAYRNEIRTRELNEKTQIQKREEFKILLLNARDNLEAYESSYEAKSREQDVKVTEREKSIEGVRRNFEREKAQLLEKVSKVEERARRKVDENQADYSNRLEGFANRLDRMRREALSQQQSLKLSWEKQAISADKDVEEARNEVRTSEEKVSLLTDKVDQTKKSLNKIESETLSILSRNSGTLFKKRNQLKKLQSEIGEEEKITQKYEEAGMRALFKQSWNISKKRWRNRLRK